MKVKSVLVVILGLLTCLVSAAFAQVTPGRTGARQTETLLIRIETKLDVLKEEAQRVVDRNPNASAPNELKEYLSRLEQSVTKLHETFSSRSPIASDLREAMTHATLLDQYLVRSRVTASAQSQWRSLKTDLTSLATANGLTWDWNQIVTVERGPFDEPAETSSSPSGTYTVPESQVRTLLSRLGLKTNNYKSQMSTALKADTTGALSGSAISDNINGLETAQRQLQQRFDGRRSTSADTTEVLKHATYIDQFMSRNKLNPQAQAQWRNLKADLNTLATYYNVNWDWNQKLPSNTGTSDTGIDPRTFDAALTGTYKLNTSLSEDATAAIDKALGSTPTGERDNYRRRLEQRLKSPESIAIEKKNTTVSLASNMQAQVTFEADGVARSETNDRGRTVTTTATADQDGLIINYQGERANDFYVTFLPTSDRRMKMTRKIYVDNGNQSITVSSVYDKIDRVPRWNIANSTVTDTGDIFSTVNDSFVVPSGTRLTAELQSSITGSGQGETFTMAVTTQGQYRGAIIGGRVVAEDAASKVAGRSRVLLIFDTIRMRDQTYKFAGSIDSVTTSSGEAVTVTNQAPKSGTTPPKKGVGGILGTVLGAISGTPADANASSAATVAGSVLSQNRDTINIGSGSRVSITATATGTSANPQ